MKSRKPKFIFVTGGVVSSLGKGLAAASIGALMENRGLEVNIIKLDPQLTEGQRDVLRANPLTHGP